MVKYHGGWENNGRGDRNGIKRVSPGPTGEKNSRKRVSPPLAKKGEKLYTRGDTGKEIESKGRAQMGPKAGPWAHLCGKGERGMDMVGGRQNAWWREVFKRRGGKRRAQGTFLPQKIGKRREGGNNFATRMVLAGKC